MFYGQIAFSVWIYIIILLSAGLRQVSHQYRPVYTARPRLPLYAGYCSRHSLLLPVSLVVNYNTRVKMTTQHNKVNLQKYLTARTSVVRLLSSPTLYGSITAVSASFILPRLPSVGALGLPDFICARLPAGLPLDQWPGRLLTVGCAFGVGYLGRKYVLKWLRLRALRTLFKYQDWIYTGSSFKTKVS